LDINIIIYLSAAIIGTLIYNYAGYVKYAKPLGEPFDWSKWLDTLIKGGGASLLLTYITTSIVGTTDFNSLILINAFFNGLAFSAGIDKFSDVVSPKKTQQENFDGLVKAVSALSVQFKRLEDQQAEVYVEPAV